MMTLPLYQVDAFTPAPFRGNPAAVCLLSKSLDEALMRAIALEMQLSETAFVRRLDARPWAEADRFALRWFTPEVEVPLCGHATLATATALFDEVGVTATAITFETVSGELRARREAGGIVLDFPAEPPGPPPLPTEALLAALGVGDVASVHFAPRTKKLLVHLPDAASVRALRPDFVGLRAAATIEQVRGVCVTAAGDADYDFVSRYFAPWVGIDEDPVTGSAHVVLAPYWGEIFGKAEMIAFQASARGGELQVRLIAGGRVELMGQAVVVFAGELRL